MPRRCSVCSSDRRREIDEALVAGASLRSLARGHGLSERALARHREGHLPKATTEAHKVAEEDRGAALLTRARQLEQVCVAILHRALAVGDMRTALAAAAEAGRLLQVQGRLLGRLAEAQPAPVVVHFNCPLPDENPPPVVDEDDLPMLGGNGWRAR